jgi:hypothetical protein
MPFSRRPLEKSLYVAEWPRRADPAARRSSSHEAGACAHDGECYDSGCGYSCLSTRDTQLSWSDCIGVRDMDRRLRDHYCGCVESACVWFTQ